MLAAKIYVARGIARHGDQDKAMEMYDAILKDATQPGTIAAADVNKGQIYLARKQWEPALLSFLELPVFYPGQKVFMPRVLLGCGHAYLGMEDYDRAKISLDDLTAGYGSTPEAAPGKNRPRKNRQARKNKLNSKPTRSISNAPIPTRRQDKPMKLKTSTLTFLLACGMLLSFVEAQAQEATPAPADAAPAIHKRAY